MRSYNNELIVYKGETFTIDKYIVCRDGSPFIISSKLKNPYFLLTIGSDLYRPEYVYNKWLKISDAQLRFDSTVAQQIELSNGEWPMTLPEGYTATTCVWYSVDSKGDKSFKYPVIDVVGTNGSTVKEWKEYNCRIITTFAHNITKEWNEQDYYWGIRLISGELSTGDTDKPITNFNTVQPILQPTRLTVLSPIDNIWR